MPLLCCNPVAKTLNMLPVLMRPFMKSRAQILALWSISRFSGCWAIWRCLPTVVHLPGEKVHVFPWTLKGALCPPRSILNLNPGSCLRLASRLPGTLAAETHVSQALALISALMSLFQRSIWPNGFQPRLYHRIPWTALKAAQAMLQTKTFWTSGVGPGSSMC